MQKIIYGILGAVVFMASADAATLRGAPMVANKSNLQEFVRASAATPNVARAADDVPAVVTPQAAVQVVNPNTGNVMTESKLPDGTVLYTDPITGEKFIMSPDGRLIAYIDENDRMVPFLNATVGQARDACSSISTNGYKGEFNELTYECMVPIVAIGTGGKISSGDGDAVAFYPFGSVVRCDAGMFDSISVMRRNSQYIVPAMIVGGAAVGAGIGYLVNKDADKKDASGNCPSGYAEHPTKKNCIKDPCEAGAKLEDRGGQLYCVSSTSATTVAQDVNENTTVADAAAVAAAQAKAKELLDRAVRNFENFYCSSLPAEISAFLNHANGWELFKKHTDNKVMCGTTAQPGNHTDLCHNFTTNRMVQMEIFTTTTLFEDIHEIKGSSKCAEAIRYRNFVRPNVTMNYKSNPNGFMQMKITNADQFVGMHKFNPRDNFGRNKDTTDFTQTDKEYREFMTAVVSIGSDFAGYVRFCKEDPNANCSPAMITRVDTYIRETERIATTLNKVEHSTWDGMSAGAKGAVVGMGIGAGVGAVAGIAYFFYEGANTKCDVGGFKNIKLDEVYRMPSFSEFMQGRR